MSPICSRPVCQAKAQIAIIWPERQLPHPVAFRSRAHPPPADRSPTTVLAVMPIRDATLMCCRKVLVCERTGTEVGLVRLLAVDTDPRSPGAATPRVRSRTGGPARP